MDLKKIVEDSVRKSLGDLGIGEELKVEKLAETKKPASTLLPVSPIRTQKTPLISEAVVVNPRAYTLKTEFMSDKSKEAHFKHYEEHVKAFNEISAKLDGVNRSGANDRSSVFRSLKLDETHNMNAIKLHELFFGNVSDLSSEITMDSLPFLRLQRDWGTFDNWQRDFIACIMSARDGWGVCGFDTYTGHYVNFFVDSDSLSMPLATLPVLVFDIHTHAYFKDYMDDKKSYIFAMMREIKWSIVEKRMMVVEKSGIGGGIMAPSNTRGQEEPADKETINSVISKLGGQQ